VSDSDIPSDDIPSKEGPTAQPKTTGRAIRSFVIRAGRSTAGQQRGLAELFPIYGIANAVGVLDFDAIFGRHAPRLIEIGFGAGEALLEYARQHPHMDCIGIEVHPPGIGHLLLGLERLDLKNVRVIADDAVEVLERRIAPASIAEIHVFFPDPWPKKRHHKRRLIQPAFVNLLARVLAAGGVLRLATDWEHYAHHMRAVLDASSSFRNLGGPDGFVARDESRVLTRFERRGQRLGHDVWDLAYERLS